MENNAKKVGWLYLAIVGFEFLISFILVIVIVVQGLLNPDAIYDSILSSPYFSLVFGQLMMIIPVIFFYIFTKKRPGNYMSYRRIDGLSALLTGVFAVCLYPLVLIIDAIVSLFAADTLETGSLINDVPLPLSILFVAVIPAIVEEFVFRGTMYGALRKNGMLMAALASGLTFGVMHMNFNQFSYAFVMGVVFVFLLEATGSMWAPMIAHFVNNAVSLLINEFWPASWEINGGIFWVACSLTAIGGIGLCWLIYQTLIKRTGRKEHVKRMLKYRTDRTCFSVPLIVGLGISFAVMVFIDVMYRLISFSTDLSGYV